MTTLLPPDVVHPKSRARVPIIIYTGAPSPERQIANQVRSSTGMTHSIEGRMHAISTAFGNALAQRADDMRRGGSRPGPLGDAYQGPEAKR